MKNLPSLFFFFFFFNIFNCFFFFFFFFQRVQTQSKSNSSWASGPHTTLIVLHLGRLRNNFNSHQHHSLWIPQFESTRRCLFNASLLHCLVSLRKSFSRKETRQFTFTCNFQFNQAVTGGWISLQINKITNHHCNNNITLLLVTFCILKILNEILLHHHCNNNRKWHSILLC